VYQTVIGVKENNKSKKYSRKFREPENYNLNRIARKVLTEMIFEQRPEGKMRDM
jgi:hypothetical protein